MPEPTFLERVPSILEQHEPLKGCKCHMLEKGHYLLAVDPRSSIGTGSMLTAVRQALSRTVKTDIPRTGVQTTGDVMVDPAGLGGMFRPTIVRTASVMVEGGPLVHGNTIRPDPITMDYFDRRRYFPEEIRKILDAVRNAPQDNGHYYYLKVKEV